MEKQRMFNNVIIGVLLFAVTCLSIAFAAFSSQLTINGTTTMSSAATNWNVAITKVEAVATEGYATSDTAAQDKITSKEISFNCTMMSTDDSCTLSGEITNLGSIKALFKNYKIQINETSKEKQQTLTSEEVQVELTELPGTVEEKVLNSQDTANFAVKVSPISSATFTEEKTYTITITFDFEQSANA